MIEPTCGLYGKNFYPKKLKIGKNTKIRNIVEPGEILKSGIYKNQKSPYGSCCIEPSEEIKEENKILWLVKYVISNKKKFKKSGITKVDFHIFWSGTQGNMEFNKKELKKLAKLKLSISITYTYEE